MDSIPAPSGNFGFKVYGAVYNDWVRNCVPNQWCRVSETVRCANQGDDNHVILIFATNQCSIMPQSIHTAAVNQCVPKYASLLAMLFL